MDFTMGVTISISLSLSSRPTASLTLSMALRARASCRFSLAICWASFMRRSCPEEMRFIRRSFSLLAFCHAVHV